MRRCYKCGEMVPNDIAECNYCGNRCGTMFTAMAPPKPTRNNDGVKSMSDIDSDKHVVPGD